MFLELNAGKKKQKKKAQKIQKKKDKAKRGGRESITKVLT